MNVEPYNIDPTHVCEQIHHKHKLHHVSKYTESAFLDCFEAEEVIEIYDLIYLPGACDITYSSVLSKDGFRKRQKQIRNEEVRQYLDVESTLHSLNRCRQDTRT